MMGGLGYRVRLAEHYELGAHRLHLEEDYIRQIGWLAPGVFGISF
jgi:hypothetical protein